MPLKRANGKYHCLFCNYENAISTHVYSHMQEAHDYLLVPFTREELVRLQQFIFTKDTTLITPEMYDRIKTFARYKIKPPIELE